MVNVFKVIGVQLNDVHAQVQKSQRKPITKGFQTIPI